MARMYAFILHNEIKSFEWLRIERKALHLTKQNNHPMNKPLTPSQKRRLLRELIELKIHHGYEVSDYMGRALSWFNYEAVQSAIQEMNNNPI